MDDLAKQDSLELEVANFGPIVEAKIDLRPLTVFVGPSNTGKSYLAILIYALHRFFSGFRDYPMFPNIERQKLPQRTIDSIDEWVDQVLTRWERLMAEGGLVLPSPVISSVLDARGDQLVNEIDRCFGIDETSALVRKGNRNDARVVFRRHVSHGSVPFEHELIVGTQGSKFKTTIPAETPIRINTGEADDKVKYLHSLRTIISRIGRKKENRNFFIGELVDHLIDPILTQLAGPLLVPASYLPADRTGVMHAHRVLVNSLINRASQPGLRRDDPLPDLSGVVTDFLKQLIELGNLSERRRNGADALAKRIEQEILRGMVQIKTSEMGYPQFFYKPDGWENALPLMNTSSMVSELAPVVMYLRHVVQPGDTLIIEEPESHLHPAMQVEFTRQIAVLVNAGVRVIVTTHSEWVLEELANIVQRSKLPKARRKEIPLGDCALRSDQVGAWLFKPKLRPKGSVVEEVKLDAETGLYPTDYDAVSAALYNESVSIFNRIEDSRTE